MPSGHQGIYTSLTDVTIRHGAASRYPVAARGPTNSVSGQINHQSREVAGTQGPLETLDRGWRSCRGIAVASAESIRTLGIGGRIVSGCPYEANSDITGWSDAGSTHPRVEVFVPRAGWIAFDPTKRPIGSAGPCGFVSLCTL